MINMDKMNKLFEELVPAEGKADTLAGEIIRALNKLCYRFYNDGDMVSVGYGNRTCNHAARFLEEKLAKEDGQLVINLWEWQSEEAYEKHLGWLVEAVVAYVEAHPELQEQQNDEDMLDWMDPERDREVFEDEDEEECWEEEYEEEDYDEE